MQNLSDRKKYLKVIQQLEKRFNFEKKEQVNFPFFKLERTKLLMDLIGNPHINNSYTIHVAGTNGKGSVCSNIESIFNVANVKTGMLTSPHLLDYTERIRINGENISHSEFIKAHDFIIQNIKKYENNNISFTFFEILTAMAFYLFKKNKVKIQIIETGLGGTFDSTNIVDSDLSIITAIGMDHQAILGESIELIAENKAGIIKVGSKTITTIQKDSVMKIIQDKAESVNATFIKIFYEYIEPLTFHDHYLATIIKIRNKIYKLKLNSIGLNQIDNISIAITAINEYPFLKLSTSQIEEGIKNNNWPCRGEIVKKYDRYFFIDGAHNEESIKNLSETINKFFKTANYFILGINSGHDITSAKSLLQNAQRIILSQSTHPKSLTAKKLGEIISNITKLKTIKSDNISDAIKKAVFHSKKNDIIICTGSLFLASEIKENLRNEFEKL